MAEDTPESSPEEDDVEAEMLRMMQEEIAGDVHGVKFTPEALNATLTLSDTSLEGPQPEKALDLMEAHRREE